MKKNIIKTTVLVAGLLWFSGCEDTCCTGDSIASKGGVTEGVPFIRPVKNIEESGGQVSVDDKNSTPKTTTIPTLNPDAVANNEDNVSVTHCEYVDFTDLQEYDSNVTYKWTNLDGSTLSDEKEFKHRFSENGLYEVTLTVSDETNATGTDKICLLVGLDEADRPLVADAGVDQVIKNGEKANLSGRVVCNDETVSYSWTYKCKVVSTEADFTTDELSEGKHEFKLTVEDIAGNKTCDTVVVTVK